MVSRNHEVFVAKIPGIKGVSYHPVTGGWKLKWRQTEQTADGPMRRQRYLTVLTEAEITPMGVEIRKALDTLGYWEPSQEPVRPMTQDLETLSVEWIRERTAMKSWSKNTRTNQKASLKRFFTALRELEGIHASDILPVRHMTRANVPRVVARLQANYAQGTVYQTCACVVSDFWPWASDRDIPELQSAPRDLKTVMPRNAVYRPPTRLPTWTEIDAMIARITVPRAKTAAVLMRATGLRLDQVSVVRGDHFDLEAGTLTVVKGKSRSEHAMRRVVPVPKWLVPELRSMGAWSSGHLVPRQDRYGTTYDEPMGSPRNLARYFTNGWEAAAQAELVRDGIWLPANREKANPTHILRARYMAHLREEAVQEYVIDFLVGHSPRSTRDVSYAAPPMGVMKAAVGTVPATANCPTTSLSEG